MLEHYRRDSGVSWLAADQRAIEEMLALLVAHGIAFTRRVAIVDLHHAIAVQEVESYRYYAQRWKWGAKRVYRLFVELGLYGTKGATCRGAAGVQTGSGGDANGEYESKEFAPNRDLGEQDGTAAQQCVQRREPPLLDNREISRKKGENARQARVYEAPEGHSQSRGASHGTANDRHDGHSTGARHETARGGFRGRFSHRRTDEEIDREIQRSAGLLDGIFDD